MTIEIFERHRAALRAACRKPDHRLYGRPNEALDQVIAQIKKERPEAFWSEQELAARNKRFEALKQA